MLQAKKNCTFAEELWGCFSVSETGNLVKMEGIMKAEAYVKCLKEKPQAVGSKTECVLCLPSK